MGTKFGIGVLCFILGVAGYPVWYRIYLKVTIEMTEEQYQNYNGISDFGYCLPTTISETTSHMESCDKFFLGYLPDKTKDYQPGGYNPLGKLSLDQVANTYRDVQSVRSEYNLKSYPPLEQLSHGLL
ncbi:hypothetical protein [Enterovibrio norvegicus]|uniref:Uncharacterized protein n=1 Tax=Enterovibrio norvegicus DSM 15893 TaxID=1121869 RepID=A0A1I5VJJ2_9GAMM|nr:hypothetical protein [Enterovibrio norvegicus]SFQ07156.1 hypothetical protein SAMN03084138_03961 [Enterovibrio norvegicus DSM 15893]